MPYQNKIHCLSAPGLSGILPSALFSMPLFLAINHLIDVCSTCLITEIRMVQCYLNFINDKWELALRTPEEAVEVAQGKNVISSSIRLWSVPTTAMTQIRYPGWWNSVTYIVDIDNSYVTRYRVHLVGCKCMMVPMQLSLTGRTVESRGNLLSPLP